MVYSSKEARLKHDHSQKVSFSASSILAVGQVSSDNLLLTLIDLWFVLLKKLDSNKTIPKKGSFSASSILAAGQVSPHHLLLTLIDLCFVLLKRLDLNKTIPKKFLPQLLPFFSRVRSVQIIFC